MAVAFVRAAPPGPAAITAVTVVPLSLAELPFASWSWTTGCWANATPFCALLDGAVVSASFVAAPAVPVAVKVTGLPVRPLDVTVSVFCPAVALSVHDVSAAIPSVPVLTGVVGVTVPLPSAGVNVTATPVTGFPFASFTITDGGGLTAVPAGAVGLVGLFGAIVAAAPAVPVAVNVTGLPVSDPDVAVRVLLPAVALSVQLPTVAMPLPLVVWVPPVTLPLPAAGVNVTATSATGFPFASFTITDGGELTAAPAVAVWLVGLFAAIVAAAPAVPVAVNVTGLPESDPDAAVSVFGPAVGLSVQEVRAAIPSVPVLTAVVGVTVPLPAVGVNVTATSATGLPFASLTITDGGEPTAVAAAPAVPVAANVTGLPDSEPEVAVSVLLPAVVPRVQLPTAAIPLASVVWVAPVTLPPPEPGAKVTDTPETGLPNGSVTITDGGTGTALPAGACCALPPWGAIVAAAAEFTVTAAVSVTVTLPSTRAVTVFVSAAVELNAPLICPLVFVVPAGCVSVTPVAGLAASVTVAPLTGFPLASFTVTVIVLALDPELAMIVAGDAATSD